jgi:hypothetical protein
MITLGENGPVEERLTPMVGRFLGYDVKVGRLTVFSTEERGTGRRLVRINLAVPPHRTLWEHRLPDGVTREKERDAVVSLASGMEGALAELVGEGVTGG